MIALTMTNMLHGQAKGSICLELKIEVTVLSKAVSSTVERAAFADN